VLRCLAATLKTIEWFSSRRYSRSMSTRSRFSRRQFLKKTSAASLGVSCIVNPRLFAAGATPSNQSTLGFIGMGKQSKHLLGGFLRRSDVRVVAVCDVDGNRRENSKKVVNEFYAKKSGQASNRSCSAYNDFRELLARDDIDGVVIATPDHWHALISIAAATAKKDIYCEKPLCQSIHEARAMVTAVRNNKRVFQTGSMQRSSREFRTAVELVSNGRIGKITRVEVAVGGPPIPCDLPAETEEPGLDWNFWLGPAPLRAYNSALSPRGVHDHFPAWRRYREYGGGGVTDWGAHHFDIVQWALQKDSSGPVQIFPAAEGADHGVKFVYEDGVEVHHISGNGITFYGTEGKLYVNRGKFNLWIGSDLKADSVGQLDKVTAQFLSGDVRRAYRSDDHFADWLQCVRSRREPVADIEIGARTVTVCHLVNLAYYHRQPLRWDPRAENFADGKGDVRWLDVNYRGPWKLA
jgi:predicted dehydrogenase